MTLKPNLVLSTEERVIKVMNGGFSQVAIVEGNLGRRVLKRLRPECAARDEKIKHQFLNECNVWVQRLAGVPFIAQAHGAFPNLDDLGPVLFLEYIAGPSLRTLLESGRLSLSETSRLGSQIAGALQHAHARGLTHRDLKPSNVMISPEPRDQSVGPDGAVAGHEVRVVDWGLAAAGGAAGLEACTEAYCSTERLNRPGLSAPADDQYSLGVILFECLAGRVIKQGENPRNVLEGLGANSPDRLVQLVADLLSLKPSERPDARKVIDVLGKLTSELTRRDIEKPFCRACRYVAGDAGEAVCRICNKPLVHRIPRRVQTGLVRVPAGPYRAGLSKETVEKLMKDFKLDPDPRNVARLTGHYETVFVYGFDIDQYPVTNTQYDEFCRACNYPKPKDFDHNLMHKPHHPVVEVTWKDAFCYCLWVGKRLPTSAEWEKAARGDKDDRLYPWGSWEENRCNHSGQHLKSTTPVDQFTSGEQDGRSLYGVADMVGNVYEWVADGARPEMRKLRGGSFLHPCQLYGLVSSGIDTEIDHHDQSSGFRCAADLVYDEVEGIPSPLPATA